MHLPASLRALACLGVWLAPAFIGAQVAPASLPRTVVTDVEYGRTDGVSLRLDIGRPRGPGPSPVAILIHGGGWSAGSKAGSDRPGNGADITPWFQTFTDAGVVWFSIDYRLAPAHRWPAQLEDVRTAIRWVKQHAAEYGGDSTRIALVGHSAGGHLAFEAALTADAATAVQAVIGFAPVTDLVADSERRGGASPSLQALLDVPLLMTAESRAMQSAASPLTHVHRSAPPTLILHGDADKTVPLAMSEVFCSRLVSAGNRCELVVVPGAPHGLLTWEQWLPDYPTKIATWISSVLRR